MRNWSEGTYNDLLIVDLDEELDKRKTGDGIMDKGDVFWIETPSNPKCILYDIMEVSKMAHDLGAFVVVDR